MQYNNDRSDVLISIDKSNVDNGGELGPKRQLLLIAVNIRNFIHVYYIRDTNIPDIITLN